MTCEPDGVLLMLCPHSIPRQWSGSVLMPPWFRSPAVPPDALLCPVTAQQLETLVVSYSGRRINRRALLDLVDSFRQQQDFHEHCVERC